MPAFGVGIIKNLVPGPHIVEYLERIDATMEPYGARFVVHGADPVVLEGELDARVVVIEFPSIDAARRWYDSDAYQAILGLRTEHSDSTVFIIDGLAGPHAATDVLSRGIHYT